MEDYNLMKNFTSLINYKVTMGPADGLIFMGLVGFIIGYELWRHRK